MIVQNLNMLNVCVWKIEHYMCSIVSCKNIGMDNAFG